MLNATSKEFNKYGFVLDGDFSSVVDYLLNHSPMPKENNLYVRDDEAFKALPIISRLKEDIYGNGAIEAGYCNGYNSKLNCLEYHTCPEVDIAATDMVLLLATLGDIEDDKLDSKKVEAFYIKKGEAVVLYPYTLHFSPCKVNEAGFKSAVILTEGTNRDLSSKPANPKLWKENKWLLAHKDSNQAKLGAYIGIIGENIEIK
ncbi:MAG: DUF4867 family protein [Bacilli bacterium]|nr:DUF4867 family protein [Bacilli bacterium]